MCIPVPRKILPLCKHVSISVLPPATVRRLTEGQGRFLLHLILIPPSLLLGAWYVGRVGVE